MHYQKNIETVWEELGTSEHGLSEDEAQQRLEEHGPNEIRGKGAKSPWIILLRQFTDPLVLILVGAALVTLLIGKYIDTIVIVAVVTVNAILGFVQEYKADKAMQALKKIGVSKATVVRDRREVRIESDRLVVGDIVVLTPGNKVPADGRICEARDLEINESTLTGESVPVSKGTAPLSDEGVAVSDRTNMAFMGTVVTHGRGRATVTATGMGTQLGTISQEVEQTEKEKTPLQRKLTTFTRVIGALAVGLAVLVVIIGVILGRDLVEMILFGLSTTVAVIPEGLPIVITVTMAVGLQRMAKRNAIIRRLIAAETLGSCNYICSDKTGTITENRMAVVEVRTPEGEFQIEGTGYEPSGSVLRDGQPVDEDPSLEAILLAGALSNTASLYREEEEWKIDGDPTEGALLVSAARYGIDLEKLGYDYEYVDEIPFSSERRYMASLFREEGQRCVLFVKGAPERLIDFCGEQDKPGLHEQAEELLGQGLRVLGFGRKHVRKKRSNLDLEEAAESDLEFLGFQALIDPPRDSAVEAIKGAREAGIKVVMVTGDHKVTAASIARQIHILEPENIVLTGEEIDKRGEGLLSESADKTDVYARVAPHHKLAIVDALQEKGNTVAVTGDGVNDAPALKKANIGVAMGKTGTDVAREAADMVLADDNFASIFEAVKVGRIIYDNIRKVSVFLLTSSVGISLAVIGTLLLGFDLPFLATQVLWINLVTNGLQDVTLAFEPSEGDVHKRPPRPPSENVFTLGVALRTVLLGATMAAVATLMFHYKYDETGDLAFARSAAVNTVVMFQFMNAWSSRSLQRSVFLTPPFSNPFLLIALVVSLLAQLAALHWGPLRYLLQTTPLDAMTWLQSILAGGSALIIAEIDKLVRRNALIAGVKT
jgi:Ca2+-transporting ATPase